MITAFLDESGTHGSSSHSTVIGGYMGTETQWAAFEDRWARMLAEYKVEMIHAKQFIPRRSPYRSWEDSRYEDFVEAVADIIRNSGIFGFACALTNKDYQVFRRRFAGTKVHAESAYGSCFRVCMVKLAGRVRSTHPTEKISFIVEAGHKNSGDAHRIFHLTKSRGLSQLMYPLGGFRTAEKGEFGALQAADVLAYGAHKFMERHLSSGVRSAVPASFAPILAAAPIDTAWITAEFLTALGDTLSRIEVSVRSARQARSKSSLHLKKPSET